MPKNENKSEALESQRIITPEFRVSYPHLFKPQNVKGQGELKYSIVMLFDKKTDLSVVKLAIKHAKISEFGPDKSYWPDDLLSPVTDGDDPKFAKNDGYKGHYAIKASSNADNKPGLVDASVKPIIEASAFYPGCYARAQVFCRVWKFMGKQGIHFILDHVQKTREGQSFGGRKAATEVFNPIENVGAEESDDQAVGF